MNFIGFKHVNIQKLQVPFKDAMFSNFDNIMLPSAGQCSPNKLNPMPAMSELALSSGCVIYCQHITLQNSPTVLVKRQY